VYRRPVAPLGWELPSGGADWERAMRQRAISARDVFSRHSWLTSRRDVRDYYLSPLGVSGHAARGILTRRLGMRG
jgi:hypothetical protein